MGERKLSFLGKFLKRVSNNYVNILQFMKPVYQGCMEKGIQHVATHAAEAAVGGGSRTSLNGKLKSS